LTTESKTPPIVSSIQQAPQCSIHINNYRIRRPIPYSSSRNRSAVDVHILNLVCSRHSALTNSPLLGTATLVRTPKGEGRVYIPHRQLVRPIYYLDRPTRLLLISTLLVCVSHLVPAKKSPMPTGLQVVPLIQTHP